MKIALDAMGGDHAPSAAVDGALDYLSNIDNSADVILVGNEIAISKLLKGKSYPSDKIKVINTTEVVTANDRPSRIFRDKPDSSLVKIVDLVKSGEADAFVSAGNTGALLVTSLFLLGKIKGIQRPALAPLIPSQKGGFILCDAGANTDVKAHHLVQFGIMAQAFIEHLDNRKNPSVGLLNIGQEKTKGNELTLKAYPMMEEHIKNFIGNIEARYIMDGDVDVVVCDGFVGNQVLKTLEGTISHMMTWFKESVKSHPISKIGLPFLSPVIKDLKSNLDYEEYGATPFLGINGIGLKSHGSTTKKGIKNALIAAQKAFEENLIEDIAKRISQHMEIIEEQKIDEKQ
jgi:phosphate acyltransferase